MRPLPFIRTVNVCIHPRRHRFFLLTLLLFLTSFHAACQTQPAIPVSCGLQRILCLLIVFIMSAAYAQLCTDKRILILMRRSI